MRSTVARAGALAGLLLGVAAFGQQPGGAKQGATDRKDEPKPAAGSLEDLIAQALRSNPDIHVAEAKMREAEAELQRTRVATAQKVATLHATIEIAQKARDEAEQRFRTAQRLFQSGKGLSSEEDLRSAKLAWERAIYEVVKLEGEMPSLLGKMPGKLGEAKAKTDMEHRTESATAAALRWIAVQQAADSTGRFSVIERDDAATHLAVRLLANAVGKAGPEGSIADKIRKALDTPIKADFRNKSVQSVLEEFRKQLGVPLRAPAMPADHMGEDFNLGEVPLGVAIQAFSDAFPSFRFVVRDYGVLVVNAPKDRLPPGAIELYDFWKSGKKAESGEEVKNPPADIIQGTVSEVDSKSGLVRIHTSGSQQGLAKGHTLEVYREKPKPVYVGRVQIIDVAPTTAVGKVVGKPHETITKGDQVTSKLDSK